jgi:integrin-linked kinase-associated serine/threonine phosphatase 2C
MEDTHVIIPNIQEAFPEVGNKIGNIRCAYYGVYDGHGGKEAADMAEKILHKRIIEDPCFSEGK